MSLITRLFGQCKCHHDDSGALASIKANLHLAQTEIDELHDRLDSLGGIYHRALKERDHWRDAACTHEMAVKGVHDAAEALLVRYQDLLRENNELHELAEVGRRLRLAIERECRKRAQARKNQPVAEFTGAAI